jgi:hypothetical protein
MKTSNVSILSFDDYKKSRLEVLASYFSTLANTAREWGTVRR